MSGLLLPLLNKRVFDFSNNALGTTQIVVIAERVDISRYIDCMAALRIHDGDMTGGFVRFRVYGDGFTEQDPTQTFLTTSLLFTSVILSSPPYPVLMAFGGSARGQYAQIQVSGVKNLAGPLFVTISVDLVLRSPDEIAATA
jgi:hypothetical protein